MVSNAFSCFGTLCISVKQGSNTSRTLHALRSHISLVKQEEEGEKEGEERTQGRKEGGREKSKEAKGIEFLAALERTTDRIPPKSTKSTPTDVRVQKER